MLTTTEAADFLGVSRPSLTPLLKAGRIPPQEGQPSPRAYHRAARVKTRRDRQLDRLAAEEEDLGLR